MLKYVLITLLLNHAQSAKYATRDIHIGVFLDEKPDFGRTEYIFMQKIDATNRNQSKYHLKAHLFALSASQTYETGDIICRLVEEDIAAIFGPDTPVHNEIIDSVARSLKIPHFQLYSRSDAISERHLYASDVSSFTYNLHPSLLQISQAIATLVDQNDWRSFTVLYEHFESIVKFKEVFRKVKNVNQKIAFRKLGNGPDYRSILKEIKQNKERRIILDCDLTRIATILDQAKQIGIMDDYHNYIITHLDSRTLDWEKMTDVTANITAIQLFYHTSLSSRISPLTILKPVKTTTALLLDALTLFNSAIHLLISKDMLPLQLPTVSCDEINEDMSYVTMFNDAVQKLKTIKKVSSARTSTSPRPRYITSELSFNQLGQRDSFLIEITEFSHGNHDFAVTSTWSPSSPDGLEFKRTEQERLQILKQEIQKRNFRVVSMLNEPYMMKKAPVKGRIYYGNDRYEGYVIDLITEICNILNCSYTFELVPDGQHGQYNPISKEWNGMIRHLLDGKADLAVADLTITYERRTAVDFTLPYMTLGISILYAKALKEPPDFLAFTNPLSIDIWLYTATSYLVISLLIFLVARFSPSDWENPHPCDLCPEELENIWSIRNCCWLTMGSIMAQGCDILPKGVSTRMVTGIWWFFSLIMTASYTANLAAFLTMERMELTVESAEDLASQAKIKYGCLFGGSTNSFFKDSNFSTYHRMWVQMEGADPTVFEKTNSDGVKRVITSKRKYAFLMESASIEYQTERNCELRQVGHWLDSKGYGIAMPPGFQYRKAFNEAILKMQEMGILSQLKTRWWKERNGGGQCKEDKHGDESTATEMGLDHVGGVFFVLALGVALALIFAFCEFLWNVKEVAVKEHIMLKEAFDKELRFAMNIWDRKKKT